MKKTKFAIIVALTALAAACNINAQLTVDPTQFVVTDFTGGNPVSAGPGTAGFEIMVGATPLTLSTLGVFDEFNDGVLNNPHTVGVWDATTQSLLAKVTVAQATATEINGYFYQNLITPITLQSGHLYRLAVQYSGIDLDLSRANVLAANVHVNSDITLRDAYLSSGSGFDFPDLNVSGANLGFFGPNAGFAPVPEPALTAMLTALALLGVGVYKRLRYAT